MTKIKLPNLFKRKASLERRKAMSGYIFVAPFLIGILAIYLPILIDSLYFSFNKLDPQPGTLPNLLPKGIEYYKYALETESFRTALLTSLQDLIFQVPAIIIFSLFIAVVLNQKMLGRALFRAIFFVPVIIATGIMDSINASDYFSRMNENGMDDGSQDATGSTSGNQLFSSMDVELLLANLPVGSELVDFVVELVNNVFNIVNYSGVQMLIFLAGLQSISPSIYEACQIEGATAWETFWKITFPMISPMILVNAFYSVIDSFTRSTNSMMVYINNTENTQANPSIETAMYWIYFLVVFLILALVGAILSAFVFYQRRD